MARVSCCLIITLSFLFVSFGCGKKIGNSGQISGASDSRSTSLQSKLEGIAKENKIPVRMMLAIAWMESRLNPESSRVVYGGDTSPVGFSIGDSAFGLDRSALGLSHDQLSNDLSVQAEAWSKFVRLQLDDADVKLNTNPSAVEDKLRWIWELSQIHRGGTRARSDVRSLFARELIRVLNAGFIWQSSSGDLIRFSAESPAIDINNLPPAYKELLELDVNARSDSPHADFLPLVTVVGEDGNKPNHIEIIHCPFSISACLEMQIPREGSTLKLEAHYVIPSDRGILRGPVQIARHSQAVRITDKNGQIKKVSDGIVIMLVGSSGRLSEGVRTEVNPSWMSREQMVDLTRIAEDICHNLAIAKATSEEKCMNIPVGRAAEPGEPIIHVASENLSHWGDVPDYDPLIYSAYFKNPGSELAGGVKIAVEKSEIKASEPFKVEASFTDRVRLIVLERMVRCPDQAGIWSKIEESQVRYASKFESKLQIWDAGPNSNGSQFIRAKVYGKDGLIGWDIQKIYTYDYDPDYATVMEDCRR